MHLDNPAIYECKKNKSGANIHYWHFHRDGTAICALCELKLTKLHADEVKQDVR